ncbi:MAG: hypothetical protein AB8G05_09800 [Oligoflexales bacterium]
MKPFSHLRPFYLYAIFLCTLLFIINKNVFALPNSAKIYITISVDWEGRDLDSKNLKIMDKFRQEHPNLPLLHFLNAAYFTKKGAVPEEVSKKIRSVLRQQDELGLHIHAWKSLIEASGVNYRHFPKWTPKRYHQQQIEACRTGDCGHEVPISRYQATELRQIIGKSLDILSKQGFPRPLSFRAGGWMASTNVLEALSQEGFLYDSSEISNLHFKEKLKDYAIPLWTKQLWPDASSISQPYVINTENSSVTEMPDNGCLADYMSEYDMLKVFSENVEEWQKNPANPIYIHFGFHQETAKKYLYRVNRAIKKIKMQAEQNSLPLEFVTFNAT